MCWFRSLEDWLKRPSDESKKLASMMIVEAAEKTIGEVGVGEKRRRGGAKEGEREKEKKRRSGKTGKGTEYHTNG